MSLVSTEQHEDIEVGSLKSLSDVELAKLATLSQVTRILTSSYDLEQGLSSVLSALMTALGANRGMVQLFEPPLTIAQPEPFQYSRTLMDTCVGQRRSVVMVDAAVQGPVSAIHAGTRSVMLQPVFAHGRVVGVWYLDSLIKTGCFGQNELKLLGIIADVVSVFLERASALGRIQDAAEETIFKLSRAAEIRDDEGGEHVQRVGLYCEALALRLGMSPEEAAQMRVASQLHDVGKLGLPDSILMKTGRFTEHEREVMKQHTLIGARILSGSQNPVIRLAEQMALTHHERWDGSGYPKGLRADEIPVAGRIVAVADVFDALVTERRYKKAWTVERAFQLVADSAGVEFDPEVARAFLDIHEQILRIRDEHRSAPAALVCLETQPQPCALEPMVVLRSATEALSRGAVLDPELRRQAVAAARTLTEKGLDGSRRLEAYLLREDLNQHHAPRLADLLAQLETAMAAGRGGPSVLLVEPDPLQREALLIDAAQRGLAAFEAEDVPAGREAVMVRRPASVVVEADLPGADEFIEWLALEHPSTKVLVLTRNGRFERRFALARHLNVFLQKPISAGAVLDHVEQELVQEPSRQPWVVQVPLGRPLTDGLDEHGLRLTVVSDVAQICAPAGESVPDLYLLECGEMTGEVLDLCRMLRNDPRLSRVPIIFIADHTDERHYVAALQAGADDVLLRPISRACLAARLNAMMHRHQVVRGSAFRDPVTGLPELRVALRSIQQLLALAVRNGVPLTLCTLRVEAMSGQLMCFLANLLEKSARSADTLTRLGEDCFLMALYGSNAEAVARRCEAVNRAVGAERCSVRTATYPEDGTRISELLAKIEPA